MTTTSKSRASGPPPAVVAAAKHEVLTRLAETALDRYRAAAVGGVELSNEGGEDILLGRDGSKWRHGWIPLNPIAAAIKAKKWKGHGGHAPPVGTPRRPSKTRLRVEQVPSGPGRTKAPRATMSNPEAAASSQYRSAAETKALLAASTEAARRRGTGPTGSNVPHGTVTPKLGRAKRDSAGVLVRPTGGTKVNAAGLPKGYQIHSDRTGHSLKHEGKTIRTSSNRESLVSYAHDHSRGDVADWPKTVQEEIDARKAAKGAAKITKPDPLGQFPGGDKAAWLEGLSRTDLDNLAWNHQARPGHPGNPEWDKVIGDEYNWRNRGGRPARDPFTGKTRMQDLKEGGRRRLDTGTAQIAARHRRETRAADRARAVEIAAEHAQSTPARRARLSIKPGTYRGVEGHNVSGTNARGQRIRVHAAGDRAEAEKVKANLAAGKDPFAHHAKKPDVFGGDLNRMAAVRSDVVKEFAKEHGSDYKLQPPMRDGMSRTEVIDQIRRNNPDVAGLDTVDVERANGRLPGWYVNLPAQKRKEFHPDASSMDKAKLGVAESAKRAREAKPKSNLRETIGGASKPDNFHTDAYQAALKSGDLGKLDRSAAALHGSGHDLHYETGAWMKADKADASRPWLMSGTKNKGKPSQARFLVRRPGHSPEAPRDAASVEFNGQHIGHILPGEHGGLKISAGNDMPEHTVRNFDQAIAGFHAVHTIREKRRTDVIAENDARNARMRAEHEARQKAAADAVSAAERERGRRDRVREIATAERNAREMQGIRKGTPTRKVTRDTPTMQKNRAGIAATLEASTPVDVHRADPKNLRPGRVVSFRDESGTEHTGHVVHIDTGTVHVSTDKATFTGHLYRGKVSGNLTKRNAAEDKAMVERTKVHVPVQHGEAGAYKSGASSMAEHFKIAEAEFRKRMDAKKAKAKK